MNYFIITGASQGFGKAVAKKLSESNENILITISRNAPDFLAFNTHFIKYDFADIREVSALVDEVFLLIRSDAKSIYLINNAATVSPMGSLDSCGYDEIVRHFNVNLISPTLITSRVIGMFKQYKCEKGIINITSGVSKSPYEGWSCYCSSKAAMAMMTQCLALENPDFLVLTYDPGVIDTPMQDYIRSQSKEQFRHINKFLEFKEKNQLQQPEHAAMIFIDKHLSKFLN